MRKLSLFKTYLVASLSWMVSCSDVLNKVPQDSYSDGTVWTDIKLADFYLNDVYRNTLNFRAMMLSGVSDECMFIHLKGSERYVVGNITPDNTTPWLTSGTYSFNNYSWGGLFPTIQKVNVFIDNIDHVPDSYTGLEKPAAVAQASLMKGEALFLRAFLYSQLCRTYGGVPLFKESNQLGQDFLAVTRASFKETVDFIVEDCDVAAGLLKLKSETVMGRATKEAALTLKSRILTFAASDLTADGTAENELVGYMNPDRTALWTAARNAAKAVIDLNTCKLADFGAPDKRAVANNYYELFRAYDLSNPEIIWGKLYSNQGDANRMNLRNANNGNVCYGSHAPTQDFVDGYQMEDGSVFSDHFELDPGSYYVNKSSSFKSKNPYDHREPRFYGSILYDSAVWQPRIYADLAVLDPLGIYDRRTRIQVNTDGSSTTVFGLDTRNGPVDKEDGSYTGYVMKKLLDHKCVGYYERNQNVWIEMRYAEVLMDYAEASLGLGDIPAATEYINKIRNRAALPDFKGDITQALRYERKIEFAFEDKRWFDIRRWKIMGDVMTNAHGMDIIERTEGTKVTTTWRRIKVQDRGPAKKHMYWIPIATAEVNKAPQLLQNPGY